jgi:hypothetical protein
MKLSGKSRRRFQAHSSLALRGSGGKTEKTCHYMASLQEIGGNRDFRDYTGQADIS